MCALALRLVLAITHDGFLGVDGGAYLLSRNAVLGDEPTGAGFPRPPLAPGFQLVPFTWALGNDLGYKVWSAVASTFPLVGVYILGRRFLSTVPLTFAILFLSIDLVHAEMFVTGALPLQGFTLIAIAMASLCALNDRWSWPWTITLALSLPITAYTNHTSSGLAAIVLPAFVLFLMAGTREGRVAYLGRILPPTVLGLTLAATALPWYLAVAPNSAIFHYPGAWVYPSHWATSAWIQTVLALGVGYWVARYAQHPHVRAVAGVLIVLGLLSPWMSTDETIINIFYRAKYLMAIPFYICITWIVFHYWWRPQLITWPVSIKATSVTAVVAVVVLGGYLWQFERQALYSDMILPSTARALEHVPERGGAVISNSFTMALWISALQRVESPHTWTWEPPRAYTETDKHVRCLLGWVDGCDVAESTAELRATHVLIDTRFPNYNNRAPDIYKAPPDPWAVTAKAPWLQVVYSEGTTILWRIEA